MLKSPSTPSKTAVRRLPAVLILFALGMLPPTHAADDPQKSLATTREQIQRLNAQISADQRQHQAAVLALQESEQRLASARKALRATQVEIRKKRHDLQALQAQQQTHRAQLAQLREDLARQMRAAFVLGRDPGTTRVLLQDSAKHDATGRLLAYHAYWQRSQAEVLQSTRHEIAALDAVEVQLQAEQAELDTLLDANRRAVDKQRTAQAERSEKLKQLEQGLQDRQKSLDRLRADEASLQALIHKLQQAKAAREAAREKTRREHSGGPTKPQRYYDQAFKSLKGRLPWPLSGALLARYGQAKGGGSLKWNGHWIAAKAGTPVKAVARGEVVHVGWLHRYGLIVLVEHEDGYYSLYGHLADTEVKTGQRVKAGETLAVAGDSGGNTQTGAYFELRKGTEPIDPARWLAKP